MKPRSLAIPVTLVTREAARRQPGAAGTPPGMARVLIFWVQVGVAVEGPERGKIPAASTCPKMTSDTSVGATAALFRASLMTTAPSSCTGTVDRTPLKVPRVQRGQTLRGCLRGGPDPLRAVAPPTLPGEGNALGSRAPSDHPSDHPVAPPRRRRLTPDWLSSRPISALARRRLSAPANGSAGRRDGSTGAANQRRRADEAPPRATTTAGAGRGGCPVGPLGGAR